MSWRGPSWVLSHGTCRTTRGSASMGLGKAGRSWPTWLPSMTRSNLLLCWVPLFSKLQKKLATRIYGTRYTSGTPRWVTFTFHLSLVKAKLLLTALSDLIYKLLSSCWRDFQMILVCLAYLKHIFFFWAILQILNANIAALLKSQLSFIFRQFD